MVLIGKTNPYPDVYLTFAHDKPSGELWVIVSDEPTILQTFAQYRLRFQVEESFLDLKSDRHLPGRVSRGLSSFPFLL